jgi:hypothetical protein
MERGGKAAGALLEAGVVERGGAAADMSAGADGA